MNSLSSIFVGVCFGYLLSMVPSKKIQQRVLIALGLVMVTVIGSQLWTNSTVWRVHNLPILATEGEKALVADIDKIDKLLAKIKQM